MVKTENEALQHGVARQHEVHVQREASSTAVRQVEALKMALNVQQHSPNSLKELRHFRMHGFADGIFGANPYVESV